MPSCDDEDCSYQCYSCDEWFDDRDDGSYSEWDDRWRCGSCHDDHCYDNDTGNVIMSYSSKPSPIFWDDDGKSSYYQPVDDSGRALPAYGIEQEVEYAGRGQMVAHAEVLLEQMNAGGEVVYLKEDGSISHGFEIVSHPATLGFFMNHFPWDPIADLANQDFKSWNRRSCGLHIHMSRAAFLDDKHLFKFLYFIYHNPAPLIQFAGRQSSYAKFAIDAFLNGYDDYERATVVRGSTFMDMAKGKSRNSDRYVAVNLLNVHTVELRFFRPSLRVETTKAALQFCDAVFKYTELIDTPSVMSRRALEFNSFRSWVRSQGERYEILSNRFDERVTS
jgi:hypothetical protein